MTTWTIDGQEFDSFESASARLEAKSKEADKRFRDAAETQKKMASLNEELDRLRAENQALAQEQTQADPQEDPQGFVRGVIREELVNRDRALNALGSYVRQMQNDMRHLALSAKGVDVDAVESYVREKFASSPSEMATILGSNRLMLEQHRLMEVEHNAKDIDHLLGEKRKRKAALTTQSGDGVLSTGERVPTLSEIADMPMAEYEKVMDRMSRDAEFMDKVSRSA